MRPLVVESFKQYTGCAMGGSLHCDYSYRLIKDRKDYKCAALTAWQIKYITVESNVKCLVMEKMRSVLQIY